MASHLSGADSPESDHRTMLNIISMFSGAEPTLWGLHTAKAVSAEDVFLEKNYIAIGWAALGDITRLPGDLEGVKAAMARAYPDRRPAAVPIVAGQVYQFIRQVKPGDIAVFASKLDRLIHLGYIIGDVKHDPSINEAHPNVRPVKWVRSLPRTAFTQGALYEPGAVSAQDLCR